VPSNCVGYLTNAREMRSFAERRIFRGDLRVVYGE